MNKTINKYSTAFTSGSLLFKESEAFILSINDAKDFMAGRELVSYNCIPVNSETSKKRLSREIRKRLLNLKNDKFIELYLSSSRLDKHLILFYSFTKTYQIVVDFMFETVLSKWYNLDLEVNSDDFQNFIYKQMDSHQELESLTVNTQKKLSQVAIRALSELGILKGNQLQKLDFDHQVLKSIALNGDSWFLELVFLNENERKEIIEE